MMNQLENMNTQKTGKIEKSKNNVGKNKIQVDLIKSGMRDFKEEIEDMSKKEKKLNDRMKQ